MLLARFNDFEWKMKTIRFEVFFLMDFVKLNVGEHRFYTTLATLGSRGENMMTALAANKDSGLLKRLKDEDGFLFLDRDSETFAHVLRLLRDPKEALPEIGVFFRLPMLAQPQLTPG